MSKKNRNKTKAERMEKKNEVKIQKKKQRIDLLKIIGVVLCISAVIILVWTIYITTDLRQQKAVIGNYLSAVQSADYDKLMGTYYPEFDDEYAEYTSDEEFKQRYLEFKLGHIINGYGEGFKIKSKITSRFDYSEMLLLTDNVKENAVLVDVKLTYYNDEFSDTENTSFVMIQRDNKWYIFDSGIETIPNSDYELINYCTK